MGHQGLPFSHKGFSWALLFSRQDTPFDYQDLFFNCQGLRPLRSYFAYFYRSTMKALFYAAELACYSGAILSLVIAIKLLRMENLTFFNSMFLVYFSLDFIFGNIETYFHFKLWRDRSMKLRTTYR